MRYAIDAATLVALAQDQRPMADHRSSRRTRCATGRSNWY